MDHKHHATERLHCISMCIIKSRFVTFKWVKVQKSFKSWSSEIHILIHAMPTKPIKSLKGQLSVDALRINQRAAITIYLIQYFDTEFLGKVRFKILNWQIILKMFTNAVTINVQKFWPLFFFCSHLKFWFTGIEFTKYLSEQQNREDPWSACFWRGLQG